MLVEDPEKRIKAEDALNNGWILGKEDKIEASSGAMMASDRLKDFIAQTTLRKEVLNYFATQQPTKKEEAETQKQFNSFDLDRDGKLNLNDLIAGYKQDGGEEKAKITAQKIMSNANNNHNGSIDVTGNIDNTCLEFFTANLKIGKYMQEANLKEAFGFYDDVNA